ncbi:hypothetical protein [Terrisporobacter mayombei]|uniref:Dockerin domain-containing protein n=1 Tax=Terrisporobacter mayombei TaxID=1541 RepID=A0ABY9Q572_9FIRM|nr:hypothetical protein [Terrisporobacter mayombei]MCC3867458.1 hypothetical protein [Terrisporobacter mayombei]WMT81717.1 hypothetical protein TEMA_20650 [Terrisporobacter mayombei]
MFRNRILKKIICILTFVVMVTTCLSGSYALSLKTPNPSVKEAINNTGILIHKNTPNPNVGTFSGEWSILCLARGGIKIPQSYYDKYYSNVVKTLKECDGVLHNMKYTEYSRVILGLTSIGKDPRNVGGYNLLEKLADFNKVIKQGINGPIFALIAFDTNNYEIPIVDGVKVQTSREKLIDYILSKEIDGGGWALSGKVPDPDITAMALQSLAPYKNEEKVKPYINRAIKVLSKLQNDKGGYSSWGTTNSESVDQVIVALCALGIDPGKDERFIKGDCWLISNLMRFYVKGGGFKHVENMEIDAMATDQGMYALVAYQRFLDGKNRLYDMTDAKETLSTGENSDLVKPNDDKDNNKDNNNQNSSGGIINQDNNLDSNTNSNSSSSNNSSSSGSSNTSGNTSNSSKNNKDATINFKIIYEGEKDGLIPENKKCIVVEFPKRDDQAGVVYDEKNSLYYSEELSKLSKSPTYIGLISKDSKKEDLINMKKYKFMKEKGEEIIFGDLNSDKIVNGQDILNLQSVLNGKVKISKDKEIIAANVTMDSKIDNGDIDSIINKFVSNKDYKVFSIYKDENKKDKESDKVSEES